MARALSLQIREALADQLRAYYLNEAPELEFQVEPRTVFNPIPPTLDLQPNSPATDDDTASFGDYFGGFRVWVRLRVAGDEEAQQEILWSSFDEADDLCVAVALGDEPTLNGYAASVDVGAPTGYELAQDLTEKPLLSVRFPVTIIAADS